MGSRRLLVLVGLVIIGLAIVLGVYFLRRQPSGPTLEEAATPQPEMTQVLIASNNLTRGMVIAEEHIQSASWPVSQLPPAYYTDPAQVLGYIVRVDIPQGMPLMPSMLARSAEALGAIGSDASLTIPPGKRAFAIPMDLLGSVAWTIQPGDHVDVLASWSISDLDEEFQSELPLQYVCVGTETACQGIYGRMEVLPTGQPIMVYPAGEGQNRYIAQVTIQNAVVLGVGKYVLPTEAGTVRPAQPAGEGAAAAEEQPTPPPTPLVQAVILVVDPQDALVLKALTELQANLDLALRAAGDNEIVTTDSVSVEYIVTRYGITPPPKLPYGVLAPPTSPLEGAVGAEMRTGVQSTE